MLLISSSYKQWQAYKKSSCLLSFINIHCDVQLPAEGTDEDISAVHVLVAHTVCGYVFRLSTKGCWWVQGIVSTQQTNGFSTFTPYTL